MKVDRAEREGIDYGGGEKVTERYYYGDIGWSLGILRDV